MSCNNARLFVLAATAFLVVALLFPIQVDAARVSAQKIGVGQTGQTGQLGNTPLVPVSIQTPAPVVVPATKITKKYNPMEVTSKNRISVPTGPCAPLPQVINYHLTCDSETATVEHDVQIVAGGWLDIQGITIQFNGPYSLDVLQNGKLTASPRQQGAQITGSGGRSIGYIITAHSGSTVTFEDTEIKNADHVYIETNDAHFTNLNYHDNEAGLVLKSSGVEIGESEFYDNNDAGIVIDGGKSNKIANNKFYSSTSGAQRIGILLQKAKNNVIGNLAFLGSDIYGNEIGILLNESEGNSILYNNIHDNTIAGIKTFWPCAESTNSSNHVCQDSIAGVTPNTIRGNTITGNGDGIIEYTLGSNIDNAQAGMISGNTRYGLVSIDTNAHLAIEDSVGVNGDGKKAANLLSQRLGACITDGPGGACTGQVRIPTTPVYAAACDDDLGGCDYHTPPLSVNDAYKYGEYQTPYTRHPEYHQGPGYPEYFSSDLVATDELTVWGHYALYTPRFLVYHHSTSQGSTKYYCATTACTWNGLRTVTQENSYWIGMLAGQVRELGNSNFEYWALTMAAGQYKEKSGTQPTPVAQLPKLGGKRPAVKVGSASVPVLRGVTTPLKGNSDFNSR